MIAGFHQSHRGINCGHAGRESISESCAFQGGQIALQRQPSGVGGAGILKALVFSQALLSIRRGLIDWSADGTGAGVRLLAGMNSSSSKTHKKNPRSPKPRMQEVGIRRTDSSVCMILVSIQESLLTFARLAEALYRARGLGATPGARTRKSDESIDLKASKKAGGEVESRRLRSKDWGIEASIQVSVASGIEYY